MLTEEQIAVEIEAVEGTTAVVSIVTPLGELTLIGDVTFVGRVLRIEGVHAQGLWPGALGRDGLNAIGRKLLVDADVDEIVIQGGTRTTGRGKGRVPKPIRFPGQPRLADGR